MEIDWRMYLNILAIIFLGAAAWCFQNKFTLAIFPLGFISLIFACAVLVVAH